MKQLQNITELVGETTTEHYRTFLSLVSPCYRKTTEHYRTLTTEHYRTFGTKLQNITELFRAATTELLPNFNNRQTTELFAKLQSLLKHQFKKNDTPTPNPLNPKP